MRLCVALLALVAATSCLGARAVERNYFVLHGDPIDVTVNAGPIDGLVRVRDMDTASVYEKFQIVVRKSPYQLRYSDQNVWAVKPNQMVSDLLAAALEGTKTFTGVTRQLLDARPAYTLSGQVLAIELYDSGDLWFAHLSLHLHMTRFGDGSAIWAYEFDQRKQIGAKAFDHGVRALSELLHEAVSGAIGQIRRLEVASVRRLPPPERRVEGPPPSPPPPVEEAPDQYFVPESPVRPPTGTPANVLTSTASGMTTMPR